MWVDVGNVVESEEENFVGAEVSMARMLLSRSKNPHRHLMRRVNAIWHTRSGEHFSHTQAQRREGVVRGGGG